MMVRHGETWGHDQTRSQLGLISVSLLVSYVVSSLVCLSVASWSSLLSPGSSPLAPLSWLLSLSWLYVFLYRPDRCGCQVSVTVTPSVKTHSGKLFTNTKLNEFNLSEWSEGKSDHTWSTSFPLCLSLSCSEDKCSIPTRCMWVKWVGRRVLIT